VINIKKLLAVGIILLFIGLAFTTSITAYDSNFNKQKLNMIGAAPDFTLIDIDGNKFTLSEHFGRVILIDFMATWCAPCSYQARELLDVYSKFSDEIIMISIDIDIGETIEQLRDFRDSFNASWIFALDTIEENVKDKYMISCIQTIVIIDREGNISFRHHGIIEAEILINEIQKANGKILYVDGDNTMGPWDGTQEHPYQYIQDAIDAAGDGYTIFVYNGLYLENLNINKAIKLIGEDRNNIVINGGKKGNVVRITKDSVTISNFTIKNSGNRDCPLGDCGIKIHSNNAIYNNLITLNTDDAFEIEDSSYNYIYENQIIDNDDTGMFFDSTPLGSTSNNVIIENNISRNRLDGILMRDSSDCTINHNILSNNGHNGLDLQYSSNNNISRNNLTKNNRFGIIVIDSPDNSIENNKIFDNLQGIVLHYSSNIIIIDNNFSSNGILIEGNKPYEWDTHTIQNNVVNNKEIRYYKNQNNRIIPVENTGQIILASCSNISIQNQHLSDIDAAIQLGFSDKIHIFNNFIYSYDGICLQESNNNTIEKNNISSFQFGIFLEASRDNIIVNNTLADYDNSYENTFYGSGIELDYSHENNISGNFIYNFCQGIYLYASSTNNTIYDNIIKNSTYGGLMLYSFSSNNTLTRNTISDNEIGMVIWSSSNMISNNVVNNNEDGVIIEFSNCNIMKYNEIKRNKKYGLYLEDTFSTTIISNNFIFNRRNSYFKDCENNTWGYNYWNRPRFFPYLIFGKDNSKFDFEVDWHPAKEPYDIPVGGA
jgi:parallel beta-helix repeat protein